MNKVLTHVAVGVAALGVGGAAGYVIGKRRTLKTVDAYIEEVNEYWESRVAELKEKIEIVESVAPSTLPTEVTRSREAGELIEKAIKDAAVESTPMYPNEVNNLGDIGEDELLPDFPEIVVETADDFTVEGQAAAIDARAFVDQFKNRPVSELGGVSFPGQEEEVENNVPIPTVPGFVSVRDPQGPYVISIDQYMDPETDPPFTKVEMRWFAGDNKVVDARDDLVPMSTVGQLNTKRFGEGTTDENQVYIRNERLSIDIELTRESGKYVHEVLGQDFEDKSPVFKMREGDDA